MKFIPHMLLREHFRLLLLIFFLVIIGYSCQKNLATENKIDSHTITNLQTWLKGKQNTTSVKEKLTIDTLLAQAKWNKGEQVTASDGKILIFIPTLSNRIGLSFFFDPTTDKVDSGNIVKTFTARIFHEPNSLLAIQTYYELVVLKRSPSTNYSGTIQAFAVSSQYLYSYKFSNGSIVSRGLISPVPQSEKVKSNSTRSSDYYNCEPWGHFTVWPSGLVTLDYTYLRCTCEQSTGINLRSGDITIKSSCASDNNTGGDPVAADSPLFYDISNLLTKDCLKALVNILMSTNFKDGMSLILQESFVNPGNKANLTFKNGDNNPSASHGASSTPTNNGWEISINENLLQNSTAEYVMTVLAHEVAHYYIFEYFKAKNITRPENFDAHALIFQDWVLAFRDLLKSRFSISDTDATGLALGGMGDILKSKMQVDPSITSDYWNRFALKYYNLSIAQANEIQRYYEKKPTMNTSIIKKGIPACN